MEQNQESTLNPDANEFKPSWLKPSSYETNETASNTFSSSNQSEPQAKQDWMFVCICYVYSRSFVPSSWFIFFLFYMALFPLLKYLYKKKEKRIYIYVRIFSMNAYFYR